MRKLMVLGIIVTLMISSAGLLACGGGGEKQAGEEPASDPSEETVVADIGDDAGGSGWKDIPVYSGATRDESEMAARMSATMSSMGEGVSSKVQLYKTGDDYGKVVSYYKSHMPGKGWEKVTDKEEGEGWGSTWQKEDGQILVNVTVVKDIEGECGIIIARHERDK